MNDEQEMRLYPFLLVDRITGKPYLARWKATADEIAKLGGEICGEPEIRRPTQSGDYFRPYSDPIRKPAPLSDVVMQPTVDDAERFIARVFATADDVLHAARTIRAGTRRGAALAGIALSRSCLDRRVGILQIIGTARYLGYLAIPWCIMRWPTEGQSAALITRRSQVQILPPQPTNQAACSTAGRFVCASMG
jgi:hypothetical protein